MKPNKKQGVRRICVDLKNKVSAVYAQTMVDYSAVCARGDLTPKGVIFRFRFRVSHVWVR
jgi:hypothetical protein